jgi:hypothetical protein
LISAASIPGEGIKVHVVSCLVGVVPEHMPHITQIPQTWRNCACLLLQQTGEPLLRNHNARGLPACEGPRSGPKCGTTSWPIIRITFRARKFGDGQSVSRFCSLFPCRNPNPQVVPTNWCAVYCCVSKTCAWHSHSATQALASNNRSVCLHATHNVTLTGTCTRNKLAIIELVMRLQPD